MSGILEMDPYLEKVLEYLISAFHACQWSSIIKYLTVTCNYTENPCLNCEPEVYYHLGFAYSKVFAYDTNVFKSIGSDVQCRGFCYIYKCFSDCLYNNTDNIL